MASTDAEDEWPTPCTVDPTPGIQHPSFAAISASGTRLNSACRRSDDHWAGSCDVPAVYTATSSASTTSTLRIRLADFVGARDVHGHLGRGC